MVAKEAIEKRSTTVVVHEVTRGRKLKQHVVTGADDGQSHYAKRWHNGS